MNFMKVQTNDGEFITTATDRMLRRAMYRYIVQKREKGLHLDEIRFVWGPIEFVPHQSLLGECSTGVVPANPLVRREIIIDKSDDERYSLERKPLAEIS